jgi:hypothetical protein
MIGGERFSDRPDCVCPVIGAFLRSWNDGVGYADRQRLEPYASLIVGTGGYRRISRIRRDMCLSYGGADLDRGPLRRAAARLRMRVRIAWTVGIFPSIWLKEGAGAYAARVCFARGGSPEAFMLLDRLLGVGQAAPALEAAPLANPVPVPTQLGITSTIGELRRHAHVPDGQDHGQGGHDGGHSGDLPRWNGREHHEEPVEHDDADHRDPEREAQASDHSHETVLQRTGG